MVTNLKAKIQFRGLPNMKQEYYSTSFCSISYEVDYHK
jgi:hypothetical protein